jgi:hypothetical protein
MENTLNFYNWFKCLGGCIHNFEVQEVYKRLKKPHLEFSSLKNRASEIKEKYNYKF